MNDIRQIILHVKEVEKIAGKNRQTLRRMWIRGDFPKPKKINDRLIWHSNDIDEWINKIFGFY